MIYHDTSNISSFPRDMRRQFQWSKSTSHLRKLPRFVALTKAHQLVGFVLKIQPKTHLKPLVTQQE